MEGMGVPAAVGLPVRRHHCSGTLNFIFFSFFFLFSSLFHFFYQKNLKAESTVVDLRVFLKKNTTFPLISLFASGLCVGF
jgi:hypothetical protein